MHKHTAFTLIELLIVVAIIAILAAIAVPNFLEAQTRSKVSRALSDMRSVGVAVEAYAVDTNHYPCGIYINETPQIKWTYGYLPTVLTTPVSYITSLPGDVFNQGHFTIYNGALVRLDGGHPHTKYRFSPRTPYTGPGGVWTGSSAATSYDKYLWPLMTNGLGANAATFIIVSIGPDKVEDIIPAYHPLAYDPTNGTVSSGDIAWSNAKVTR